MNIKDYVYIYIYIHIYIYIAVKMNTLRPKLNGNQLADDKKVEFQITIHWNMFLRDQLTIWRHRFRQWLDAERAKAIIWTNVAMLYWRIYASLGINELTRYWVGSITPRSENSSNSDFPKHTISRPQGRVMGCLLGVHWKIMTARYCECSVFSLNPSDVYRCVRHQIRSLLFQIMICWLFCAEPLSDPSETNSMKFSDL